MSVKQCIILHCCFLLLALTTTCRTQTTNSGQAAAGTQTTTSQTTSSTEQPSSQTPATNSANAPTAQNSSTQNSNTTEAATPPPSGKIDACSLITRAEIASAQGEQITEARSSTVNRSRFSVSQCYYVAAASVKSVSLELTQRANGQSGAASPREFWEERFEGADRKKGREREREEKGKRDADNRGGREREEEEEGSPPVRVTGVGDEAFWVGNRIVGALYVLKGDAIIRISIGGPEAENIKIEKMKALARMAVLRLKE